MGKILFTILILLHPGYELTYNMAKAESLLAQDGENNKHCFHSEELQDEAGFYTLKILNGQELQALVSAQQDLMEMKNVTVQDVQNHHFYIYSFKDFYEIHIRAKQPSIPTIDGWEIFYYAIDAKDFSIISRQQSIGSKK